MQKRTVSVIIGTRNRPNQLREALASIRALEGPDLTFQILVGDNGTTPETVDVVAEFGAIYDRTDVYGCPAARNLAMRQMTGDFVAFLDDDDVWTEHNIRPHIALMDADPEIAAVFGQIVFVDDDLQQVAPVWPTADEMTGDIFTKMLGGYFPQVGATVVRGDVARKCGLMDESLIGDSDWDWQLRITRDYKTGFTPTPSVMCRGRPPGSYDDLQRRRAGYTRLIFWRHAPQAWRRFGSPLAFARAYYGNQQGYYDYFVEAAANRVLAGDAKGARSAILDALRLNPVRSLKSLLGASPLRFAARRAFLPGRIERSGTPEAAS